MADNANAVGLLVVAGGDVDEASLSEILRDFLNGVDVHVADQFGPFLALGVDAVGIVADDKHAARLEHSEHLGQTFVKCRPVIDGLKCRGDVDGFLDQGQEFGITAQDFAAPGIDGFAVD